MTDRQAVFPMEICPVRGGGGRLEKVGVGRSLVSIKHLVATCLTFHNHH